MQVYGQLQNAALEVLASDPASTVQGRVWFNSTSLKVMADDGTNKSALLRNDQKCVFGTSGTAANNVRFQRGANAYLQFVTGDDVTVEGTKSTSLAQIDGRQPNFTFSGLPTAGSAGRTAWVTDQSALYLDNGSSWQQVGSASGAKNYLGTVNGTVINGNFELNATTGWTLFNTSLTGTLPTGSISAGASSVGTFNTVSSSQLAGNYSLQTASAAAWSAGQGFISDSWTIDAEDAAKVLSFKFYYKAVSNASNGNFSGTSSNTFAVYIYDNANSAWIQPAGVYNITQSSGVGYATGSFQTPSNATSFRFAVVAVNASAGAITLYWDDFFCGPQTQPIGPALSDWVSYTPTWVSTGTAVALGNGTATGYWRRVGDSMEVQIRITSGTTTTYGTGNYRFSLPSGYTIDSAKVTGALDNFKSLGTATAITSASVRYLAFATTRSGDTSNLIAITDLDAGTGAIFGATAPYTPSSSTAAQIYELNAMVPISGWSSNVSMSSDTDTRVTAGRATGASASVSGSYSDVTWATIANDTHSAFNAASSATTYVIPVTGYYNFGGQIFASAATIAAGQNFTIGLLNATSSTTLLETQWVYQGTNVTATAIPFNYRDVLLNAGTSIKIQVKASTSTPAISASATENFLSVERVTGPAVVAATESVNARYYSSVTSISGSLATINYATKDFDSHGSYSAGTYTVCQSGKYKVCAAIAFSAASAAAGNAVDVQLQKNGSVVSEVAPVYQSTQVALPVVLSDIVSCVAGDTLRIQASSAATTPAITSSNSKNFISITRVGN